MESFGEYAKYLPNLNFLQHFAICNGKIFHLYKNPFVYTSDTAADYVDHDFKIGYEISYEDIEQRAITCLTSLYEIFKTYPGMHESFKYLEPNKTNTNSFLFFFKYAINNSVNVDNFCIYTFRGFDVHNDKLRLTLNLYIPNIEMTPDKKIKLLHFGGTDEYKLIIESIINYSSDDLHTKDTKIQNTFQKMQQKRPRDEHEIKPIKKMKL